MHIPVWTTWTRSLYFSFEEQARNATFSTSNWYHHYAIASIRIINSCFVGSRTYITCQTPTVLVFCAFTTTCAAAQQPWNPHLGQAHCLWFPSAGARLAEAHRRQYWPSVRTHCPCCWIWSTKAPMRKKRGCAVPRGRTIPTSRADMPGILRHVGRLTHRTCDAWNLQLSEAERHARDAVEILHRQRRGSASTG